jgi:hypothetical protein
MKKALLSLTVLTALLVPMELPAHGAPGEHHHGGADQVIKPAVPGSLDFAEALARSSRHLFTSQQHDTLDRMARHFAEVRQIESAPNRAERQNDADWNRTLGEGLLSALVENFTDVEVIDYRPGAPAPRFDHFIKVAERASTIILRAETGAGPTRYSTVPRNLGQKSERDRSLEVLIEKPGTTWVILELDEIPSGKSALHLALRGEKEATPSIYHAIQMEAEPSGSLQVTVTDETGTETPTLMRLTARDSGRLLRPANAVDFSPLMDAISGIDLRAPNRAHPYYTPANYGGWYWVVPGPLDMATPPGEWEIRLTRGIEYRPVVDNVTITGGAATKRSFQMERWVNMPARGWWSGDDHVHSRLMSDEDARLLLAYTRATDTHMANILEMGNEMRTWYRQRGFGPEFRTVEGNYALVPGQEDPRYRMGHAIGLNIKSLVRDLDKYLLNDWVADTIHEQGGLYGHTHVGHKMFNIERDMTLLVPRGKSDFSSILQGFLGTDYYYDFLDLGYRLTASAGSDIPYGAVIGQVKVYCYTGAGEPFSPDRWFEALRKGNTFVTNGPMMEFTIDGQIAGSVLEAGEKHKVRIVAETMGGSSSVERVQLIRFGKPVAEIAATDRTTAKLVLETEIDPGFGGWYCAQVKAIDGTVAHSSPIYIERKGFRTWNPDRVAGLIKARRATLDDILAMVAEAEAQHQQPNAWAFDYYRRWAALQAPQVRERVAIVRALFDELEATWTSEQAARAK